MKNKIVAFAKLVETETIQRLQEQSLGCQANLVNAKTHIHEGKKYTRVDIGTSGRYMIENATGNIFGIKAYGQVHKGHFYGTVDTTADFFWGNYYPERKTAPLPKQGWSTIPKLTFAPEPVETQKVMVNGIETEIPTTHHVVKNLLSGQDVIQAKDTPLCCDVSSETYHSM